MGFPGGQVLVGSPKKETQAYTKVLLRRQRHEPRAPRLIVDGQGNRNRFDFTDPKVNVPVPADAFVLNPPRHDDPQSRGPPDPNLTVCPHCGRPR